MRFKISVAFFAIILISLIVLICIFSVNFFTETNYRNFTSEMVRDFAYPVARRDESVTDDFHGTKVMQTKCLYSKLSKISLAICLCRELNKMILIKIDFFI